MPTLSVNNAHPFYLSVGQHLTLNTVSSAEGEINIVPASGSGSRFSTQSKGRYGPAALNAAEFGPYSEPVIVTVTPLVGSVDVFKQGEFSLQLALVLEQLLYMFYGDSLANPGGNNFDVRQILSTLAIADYRGPAHISGLSNGTFRYVANCGISGETTAQMITRESAGAGATRKSIADGASCGAKLSINFLGTNDLPLVSATATDKEFNDQVTATSGNILFLLKRQRGLGLYPLTYSINGYAAGTAAQNAIRARFAVAVNAAVQSAVIAARGMLGTYRNIRDRMVDANGATLAKYELGDGAFVHWNAAAWQTVVAPDVVQVMLRIFGLLGTPEIAYPLLPNLITNQDFSAATSGVATGVAISAFTGTSSRVNQVVEFRGMNWQECIFTPTGQDGNGNTAVNFDITIPNASIIPGDVIGSELSIYVDDGNGGAPNVFQFCVRQRSQGVFSDMPSYNATVSPKVNVNAPIDMRVVPNPHIAANAAPTSSLLTLFVFTCLANNPNNSPVRVRVAYPRTVKLPVGLGNPYNSYRQSAQVLVYAATLTPDALAGTPIKVTPLTGALTIAAPLNPQLNQIIDFAFEQGAPGSSAITWNAVFRKAADGAAGATGTKATTSFVYDGAHWVQRGGALAWI